MSELKSVNISIPETAEDDPRIGQLIQFDRDRESLPKAVILGFPSDEGVRRNNGRPGASGAPDEIRRYLYAMTPPAGEDKNDREAMHSLLSETVDLGNLTVSVNVEQAQDDLANLLSPLLKEGIVPIILGGGHETAYGHFLAYVKNDSPISILNMDAHPDVRPPVDGKPHSGSSFREAMLHESDCCNGYMVAGLQPNATAQAHLEFIDNMKGSYLMREDTTLSAYSGLMDKAGGDGLMVTFDMDAIDQSYAPGVSAPCMNGLEPGLWLKAAFRAGSHEKVRSFDLSEVNPAHDRDGQTARLAALTVWNFLHGLSRRT